MTTVTTGVENSPNAASKQRQGGLPCTKNESTDPSFAGFWHDSREPSLFGASGANPVLQAVAWEVSANSSGFDATTGNCRVALAAPLTVTCTTVLFTWLTLAGTTRLICDGEL